MGKNDRRTGVTDTMCNETEIKAVGKMLQDVPMIVFFADSKFNHLKNEDIFNIVPMD